MKIFIVGGTGVLGKKLIPLLVQNGHEVNVLSRSDKNDEIIMSLHANPIHGDIFDKDQLVKASQGNDIYLHIATAIPTNPNPSIEDWKPTMRLRTEGVKNLLEACSLNGGQIYIQMSTTFVFGNRDGDWVDEQSEANLPVMGVIPVTPERQEFDDNIVIMEKLVQSAIEDKQVPASIIRFGWFYGKEAGNVQGFFNGNFNVINEGSSYISLTHIDDAANALAIAVEKYQLIIGKTIHVVDDQPVTWNDLLNYAANQAQIEEPRQVSIPIDTSKPQDTGLNFLLNSVRVRNHLAKDLIGWEPKFKSYKEGLRYEYNTINEI